MLPDPAKRPRCDTLLKHGWISNTSSVSWGTALQDEDLAKPLQVTLSSLQALGRIQQEKEKRDDTLPRSAVGAEAPEAERTDIFHVTEGEARRKHGIVSIPMKKASSNNSNALLEEPLRLDELAELKRQIDILKPTLSI